MTLRQQLRVSLQDSEYRHAYADEQLTLSIGTQIKVLREQQQMTQGQLAEKIGTKQAGVSRLESSNYTGWSIAALRRLAQAFDLRLRVSFEEFGTLWKEVATFSRQSLLRKAFSEDPEFRATAETKRKIRRRRSTPTHRHHIKRRIAETHPAPPSTWSPDMPDYQSGVAVGAGNNNSGALNWPPLPGNNNSMLAGGIYAK